MKRSEFPTPVKTAVSGTYSTYWNPDAVAVAHIETWYDKHSRNYITMFLDADDNEVSAAEYTGNREDAKFAHGTAVNAVNEEN